MTFAATLAVLRSEFTKFRSVRSTLSTLVLTFGVGVGVSVLSGVLARRNYAATSAKPDFDPVGASFVGITFAEITVVVFGVLLVTTEYASGTIRPSLAAVPHRGMLYGCKVLTGLWLALAVSMVTSFTAFLSRHAFLGEHGLSLRDDGALRAAVGVGLFLTLLCVFCVGVATMLRSSVLALGVLLPFLFVASTILGNLPKVERLGQYLPSVAGNEIMRATPGGSDLGPWTALLVVLVWAAAAVLGGYLVMRGHDA